MNPTPASEFASVDDYLAALSEPARTTLETMRARLRAEMPTATEGFSYGVPAFKVNGKGIAGYNAGRTFCSYYPMSGRVITKLADELAAYETTSGAIHFRLDKPLPVRLIRLLVRARLAEAG
jgi:uncharacterized protein YdhG (YjbR/CyaY superfamily)